MAFGTFKSVDEVALTYQISVRVAAFVQPTPVPVDERFRAELIFALQNVDVRASEAAICEFLIVPVLREVWKPYSDSLLFWSHVALGHEDPLQGVPDYLFTRRSPLGLVRDRPYVLVVEAKKDDFEAGWAQCLAAMVAAQRLNEPAAPTVHGCVSNGSLWQLGRLQGKEFTRELREFVLSDLDGLFAAWSWVLAQAREQALAA